MVLTVNCMYITHVESLQKAIYKPILIIHNMLLHLNGCSIADINPDICKMQWIIEINRIT